MREHSSAIWTLIQGSEPRDAGAEVHLSLASADGPGNDTSGPAGGPPSLKSGTKLWNTASEGVGALRGNLGTAITRLDESQNGMSTGDKAATGFLTGSAQSTVHHSWDRYLDLIRREADELGDKLTKAGNDHYKNEEATAAAFRQQQTRPVESGPGSAPPPLADLPSWSDALPW
ncbi:MULTISPECIES: hypothetical protein [unclassified Streptomyces]|uniref:hypothetical protein n=1 Tax=unclassified Streptomyces TaxID=2593676 RepID=UPI0022B66841|nr:MULTISPECIES: hypothetical protein [unclassified Streptomyces]MCZ7416340.1 hypothetical protein [Streptomyces sp. WMMC897]MCZ7433850.1 hypothetical protein [Streptomyces sp. WMMC1477]